MNIRGIFASTRVRVVAGAVALLLVGGVGGAVVATALPAHAQNKANGPLTTVSATDNTKYCQVYEQSLEKNLNTDQKTLESANQKALDDAIDAAVTDGKLTSAEAAMLKQQIASNSTDICAKLGQLMQHSSKGQWGNPGDQLGAMLKPLHDAVQSAVATKLGISTTALQTALQNGTDIVTLAGQHNVDKATLNSTIETSVKSQLDTLVSSKLITQDQENMAIQFITNQVNAGHYGIVGLAAPHQKAA